MNAATAAALKASPVQPPRAELVGFPWPSECYGPAWHEHKSACCMGRPACRWRRAARNAKRAGFPRCSCAAYHFPHRPGSGRCGNAAAMDAFVYGPADRPGLAVCGAPELEPPPPAAEPENLFADLLAS